MVDADDAHTNTPAPVTLPRTFVPVTFVVVTGRSGAGKSTVLSTLEDQGYYVVDNIPPSLWLDLLTRCTSDKSISDKGTSDKEGKPLADKVHLAVGLDVRAKAYLGSVDKVLTELGQRVRLELIYLDASDDVLIQRYNFTRRLHPLPLNSLKVALAEETRLLSSLKERAQWFLDTSAFSAKQLTQEVQVRFGEPHGFYIRLLSFGFKYGVPVDADNIIDLRTMPNPYYDPNLRPLDGRHPEVAAYAFSTAPKHSSVSGEGFYETLEPFIHYIITTAEQAGRLGYTVAVGCTGGKHRSVAVAERLVKALVGVDPAWKVHVHHRDVAKDT